MAFQPKKLGIFAPKAGKTQQLVKSLVKPDMRARGPPGGVMSSKTGWVIYREVDQRPGAQNFEIGARAGYPLVVGLLMELLSLYIDVSI